MKNKTSNNATANAAAPADLGHSPNVLAQRKAELLALLAQTAPELMSDNQIDLDKLKDLLEPDRIADPLEHYELSWAGKAAARREIQQTSSHTLRPDANNPAQAQHMLIEGENLEVLRVLQKSYYGKVKMIYIDPPYNTGNDSFVYPDNYAETLDEYQRRTGEKNEAGFLNKQNLWKKNSKESGQYHSAWLSMMYPRLYLARNLLRDDGVIFISIDDNEAANLKVLCDEVFGIENFVGSIAWQSRTSISDDHEISLNHNYILIFSKSLDDLKFYGEKLDSSEYQNRDQDPRGPWKLVPLDANKPGGNTNYPINNPATKVDYLPPEGRSWAINPDEYRRLFDDGRIAFGVTGDSAPKRKLFLLERLAKGDTKTPSSVLLDAGTTKDGSAEIQDIFRKKKIFSYPKPVTLLRRLIQYGIYLEKDQIVLDFFAGSGTTAHAVMELNLEDDGNRQSISVQMPELLADDSEAYKAGYRTIADITRARIDKVIAKLKAERPDKTADLACAHFTLAPSNFKVWRGNASSAEALRDQLALFRSAEKADPSTSAGRTDKEQAQAAMLAELLLKHGLGALGVHAISKPKQLAGATVHRVLMPNDKTMWLCFDPYTEALKGEIVKAAPAQVVLLNSSFVGSKADELLANLQLELAGLEIGLTVI